jgi:hypothetical protein
MSLYYDRWNRAQVVQFATEIIPDDPNNRLDRGPFNYCLGIHEVPCGENSLPAS